MRTQFERRWQDTVNLEYLAPTFYYDVAKEVCPGTSAHTLLWRRCCLEKYRAWAELGQGKSSCQAQFYATAMLGSSANVGIQTGIQSRQRAGGLLYGQVYAKVKEVFAAGSTYPFGNSGVESLALDPKLLKAWQYVGGAISHDPVALIKAYLFAKNRCHHGTDKSGTKSFGVREETRVRADLLQQMDDEFQRRRASQGQLDPPTTNLPYLILSTQTVMNWLRWNINKFCAGFEMVHSLDQSYFVTWEHTRVMLMFLRCLQRVCGSGRLQDQAGLWHDVHEWAHATNPGGVRRIEGLGFSRTLFQDGYAWFLDKVDWETMTFKQPYASFMLFSNPSMQYTYHARYRQVANVKEEFLRVNKIQQWLGEFQGTPACLKFLGRLLRQMCLEAFRKDVFQQIKPLIQRKYRADALAGRIPLCYPSIQRVVKAQHRPLNIVKGPHLRVSTIEVLLCWLWEWRGDLLPRKHWDAKPYRMLYQHSYHAIRLVQGKEAARRWKSLVKESVLKSHWMLPYPQATSFIRRDQSAGRVYWWSIYHPQVERICQEEQDRQRESGMGSKTMDQFPGHGWQHGSSVQPGLKFEIQPEADLLGLEDAEIYSKLLDLQSGEGLEMELEAGVRQRVGAKGEMDLLQQEAGWMGCGNIKVLMPLEERLSIRKARLAAEERLLQQCNSLD